MNMIAPPIEKNRQLDKSDIPAKVVTQRMIGDNSNLIKEGLIADRPEDPQLLKFYYASDEDKLYHYSKSTGVWKSITFS